MAGPLPLPIEHNPSAYGEEVDTQRNIQQAAQYNPATKLGITNADQAAKGKSSFPTGKEALAQSEEPKLGLGPKTGLENDEPVPGRQVSVYQGPHPFASRGIAEHKSHLSRLTNLSPAMQQYLRGGK